jgi:anti-anti-sigma factor
VDGAVFVYLAGDLDLATAEELRSRLMRVVESGVEATVVLDLSWVHFVDAAASE